MVTPSLPGAWNDPEYHVYFTPTVGLCKRHKREESTIFSRCKIGPSPSSPASGGA